MRHLGTLRLAHRISVYQRIRLISHTAPKYDVDAPLMDHLNPNPIRLFPAQFGAIGWRHVCTLGLAHRDPHKLTDSGRLSYAAPKWIISIRFRQAYLGVIWRQLNAHYDVSTTLED